MNEKGLNCPLVKNKQTKWPYLWGVMEFSTRFWVSLELNFHFQLVFSVMSVFTSQN